MTRADIKAELPGEQYTPSNGTEGAQFLSDWCGTCARDKSFREGEPLEECDDNETCPIIAASFRGEAIEWREMPDRKTLCTQWVQAGEPIPPPRDVLTIDMFGEAL